MQPFILDIVIANPKRNLFPRLPGVGWLLGITLAGLVLAAPLPAHSQIVTQGQLVATFHFGGGAMVYDYARNRVYATVPASNSVAPNRSLTRGATGSPYASEYPKSPFSTEPAHAA